MLEHFKNSQNFVDEYCYYIQVHEIKMRVSVTVVYKPFKDTFVLKLYERSPLTQYHEMLLIEIQFKALELYDCNVMYVSFFYVVCQKYRNVLHHSFKGQ